MHVRIIHFLLTRSNVIHTLGVKILYRTASHTVWVLKGSHNWGPIVRSVHVLCYVVYRMQTVWIIILMELVQMDADRYVLYTCHPIICLCTLKKLLCVDFLQGNSISVNYIIDSNNKLWLSFILYIYVHLLYCVFIYASSSVFMLCLPFISGNHKSDSTWMLLQYCFCCKFGVKVRMSQSIKHQVCY